MINLVISFILVNFMYGNIELIEESQGEFSRVIREGIAYDQNPLIKDIAMLGAHDAFSHDIHLFSSLDPAESSSSLVSQTPLRWLLGGVFVRYSKAQTVGTASMLSRGVRYFDIRVSYHNDSWMTKHGLISNHLSHYLLPFIDFLSTNPGEFVILDFQHVYLGSQSYADLIQAIISMKIDQQSIFDFVHYSSSTPIHQLTYDEVTYQKTKGGVVILFNTSPELSQFKHYSRLPNEGLIRSTWHDTANLHTLIESIHEEHRRIQALRERPFLSVNQAQRTSNFSLKGISDTLFGWSLLSMAKEGNARLLEEDWISWLETMPILMVDFATTNHRGFNVLVNEGLIAYNLTL